MTEVHRSPVLAAIFSLILPGAGHIYARQTTRGIGYFLLTATFLGLLYWTRTTHEFEVFTGMLPALATLAALFWLWVIGSAVAAASGRNFAPTLGLLIVLGYTYLLGWQVTEVNMRKFLTEFPDTFNIFRRVIWPWRAAIERPEELQIVATRWANPCPDDPAEMPEQVEGSGDELWITVDPACGEFATYAIVEGRGALQPGTEITVRGGGFDPNERVEIWWEDPIGNEFQPIFQSEKVNAMADANGYFSVTFTAPQFNTPSIAVGTQYHGIQARQVVAVGNPRLTQNFILAINRMIVTIFQALMATTFGIVLAIPFSFLAARNLMWGNPITRFLYYAIRFVLNITRSIEPIIWAVIAVVWVGLGPFAGVIALTVHTIASLAKLYSEAIESIDPGPIEAITATGANRIQTIVYAIIPQVVPPFLSFTIYRWDINVRMSTIIGFVGGGGIGQLLFQWINQTLWYDAGMAVWLIAITVSVMDYASGELRKRFV